MLVPRGLPLKNLFSLTGAPECTFFVEEAWALDIIQQGDSGLVNADKLIGHCMLRESHPVDLCTR